MNIQPDQSQGRSILGICLMASFADGSHADAEREEIRSIAETLGGDDDNGAATLQDVLFKRVTLESLCAPLKGQPSTPQVYEMAVGVCGADKITTPEELKFLGELRGQLGLPAAMAVATELINPAPIVLTGSSPAEEDSVAGTDNERMILNYAILNGALELLPQSLATMAVIPMQLKMVYRIGRSHGVELDTAQIKELAATAGLGLTSQVLEGYARRLLGSVLGRKSMASKVTGQATSSAFSFASTYALGNVAQAYYSGGRQMTKEQMKSLFDSVSGRARGLYENYLPQIQDKAKGLDLPKILAEIKSPAPTAGA